MSGTNRHVNSNGKNRRTAMKARDIAGAFLAVAVAGALVACGGGDDDDGELSGIRTQKGLAVAAVAEGLATGEEDNAASDAAAPLPPAAGGSTGTSGFAQERLDAGITRDAARFGAPLLQQGADGITVQGFGSATANADAAIVELYYSRNGPVADTPSGRAEPGSAGGAEPALAPDQQEVQQITEAELQPVIDAIVAAGVPREDVQFVGQPYFDKFYSSATLRVTVSNVDSVDAVVQAATNASAGVAGIVNNGTNVSYTVNDCAALEEAAMKAAVEDAGERAAVFARALGVGVGSVTGASNYSYFGGTPCDPGFYPGPYPLGGITYAQGQPREVQVIANIGVTYAMQ
jgi:Protein of unknown function (DUF541)